MFENGSLLRRRKRFKLHKPDKELLKSELQALASAIPPPHSDSSPILSVNPSVQTSSLTVANLHRIRDDLLRWEFQERRLTMASSGNSPPQFPTTETASNYYLLSPEARQRLTGTDEVLRGYENNILQTRNWGFPSFQIPPYISQLSYFQTELPEGGQLCPATTESGIFEKTESRPFLEVVSGSNIESDDVKVTACEILEPGILKQTNVQPEQKKKKKPFTIENIIAPDEEQMVKNLEDGKKGHLLVPRPLYPGFQFGLVTSKVPYETATWSWTTDIMIIWSRIKSAVCDFQESKLSEQFRTGKSRWFRWSLLNRSLLLNDLFPFSFRNLLWGLLLMKGNKRRLLVKMWWIIIVLFVSLCLEWVIMKFMGVLKRKHANCHTVVTLIIDHMLNILWFSSISYCFMPYYHSYLTDIRNRMYLHIGEV